jgi:hypothetical protein
VRLQPAAERIDQLDIGAGRVRKEPDRTLRALTPVSGELEPFAHWRRIQQTVTAEILRLDRSRETLVHPHDGVWLASPLAHLSDRRRRGTSASRA